MSDSCLFPFYEYIMKSWVGMGIGMPEYEQVIRCTTNISDNSELEDRKKEIWSRTKEILEYPTAKEQIARLKELQSTSNNCGLCLYCQNCEKNYWEQLELALNELNGDITDKKCEFLLPNNIKKLLEQSEKPVDIYLDSYKRRNFTEANYLVMLKGFSSSTPILLNHAKNTEFYSGGGFYLRWNGVGIAIDPGYMFVKNLHDYGLSVLDVDVVIVTHEHIDHSNDLRLLDDLHYSAASAIRESSICWDEEDFSLNMGKVPKHKIKWYLDSVTYEETVLFSRKSSGFSAQYNEIYCIAVDDSDRERLEKLCENGENILVTDMIELSEHVSIKVFPTRHEQFEKDGEKYFYKHTYGCTFQCGDEKGKQISIGYTSDTSIQKEIRDTMISSLSECDIIISNISGIYREDVLLKQGKARHLGYFGCLDIIKELLGKDHCQLRYFLLSEFSNQVSDIRYSISKYMQQEVNRIADYHGRCRPMVIPSEIGCTIKLAPIAIRCTSCGGYSEKVFVLNPFDENMRIRYICPECLYSKEEV